MASGSGVKKWPTHTWVQVPALPSPSFVLRGKAQQPSDTRFLNPQTGTVCRGFSRVRFFVTPWAVARQAPLSMGFSRQEY